MDRAIECLKAQGFSEEKAHEIAWRFALTEYLRQFGWTNEHVNEFIKRQSK